MPKTNTKYTSQHIDNQSFDEALQMRVTELIGADGVLKNPATEEKQDTMIAALGGGDYAVVIRESGAYTYIGKAAIGSSTASAVWQVKRLDTTTLLDVKWADGNANFDNVATDLTALSYS